MRILLLMTSSTWRASAFLDAARTLGVTVVVGSERTQALAWANPGGHLTLDFGAPSALESIAAHAARHPLDAIVAADDDGAVLAARAAARLGLRHATPAAVATARDKFHMRRALAGRRVGSSGPPGAGDFYFASFPLTSDPARLAGAVPYPCVIKPRTLAGSRGVIRADDATSFVAAFRRSAEVVSAAGAAPEALLVEEFLPGSEVAVEGILTDGALQVLAIFDKPDPLDGPFFEETLYVTPSRLPARAREALTRATADTAAALGLTHGPVHAELRWDGTRAALVEIAPRSIGGLCSRALRFEDDGALEVVLLRHALGEDVAGARLEPGASGVLMIPIPRAGVLAGVRGADAARSVPGIDDVRITVPIGERLVPLPEGARYLGFVFARGEGPGEVEAALRRAHQTLEFEIDAAGIPVVPGGGAPR